MKEEHLKELGNELRIQIKFSEIDMMNVVHHSKYWIWFEEARFNFIENVLGISINDIESSNILIPLIDCSCTYINAIKWSMQIKVIARLELKKSPYIIFHYEVYEVYNDSDKIRLLCKSWTKHAFIDKEFKLKLEIPVFFRKEIDKHSISKADAFFFSSNS